MSNKTVPLTEVYSAYTQPLEPQILEEIPKKKWAAITALVLSLIAFFTGILVIGFVPAIFAIVFAGIALGQVKKGEAEGAGMAIGAIIFASLAIIASVGIDLSAYFQLLHRAAGDRWVHLRQGHLHRGERAESLPLYGLCHGHVVLIFMHKGSVKTVIPSLYCI